MRETGCIHFATVRTVLADPAMELLYLASMGLH